MNKINEEYEIEADSGKYPKQAFSGIFNGYEFTENSNGTKVLRLNFDEDTIIDMYGRGKLKEGKAPGNLGAYISSLAALKIKSYAIQEDGEMIALRHEPDILNAKISIEPIIEKRIGSDNQNKESIWWGKVIAILLDDSAQKPELKLKVRQSVTPEKTVGSEFLTRIEDLILEGVVSVGDIYKALGGSKSVHKPAEIREAIAILQAKEKKTVSE